MKQIKKRNNMHYSLYCFRLFKTKIEFIKYFIIAGCFWCYFTNIALALENLDAESKIKFITSIDRIKSYQIFGTTNIEIEEQRSGSPNITNGNINYFISVDRNRNQMKMETNVIADGEQKMETKIIVSGGLAYVNSSLTGQPGEWQKKSLPQSFRKEFFSTTPMSVDRAFMESSEIKIINKEIINGINCVKLEIFPNKDFLSKWLASRPEMSKIFNNFDQNMDFTDIGHFYQWYSNDDGFLVKSRQEISINMYVKNQEENGRWRLKMVSDGVYSRHNEKISIDIPPDAK